MTIRADFGAKIIPSEIKKKLKNCHIFKFSVQKKVIGNSYEVEIVFECSRVKEKVYLFGQKIFINKRHLPNLKNPTCYKSIFFLHPQEKKSKKIRKRFFLKRKISSCSDQTVNFFLTY